MYDNTRGITQKSMQAVIGALYFCGSWLLLAYCSVSPPGTYQMGLRLILAG